MEALKGTAIGWTTRNLVFHDEAEVEAAERLLNRHMEDAVGVIVECLPGASVILSGSLARGEPALRHEAGGLVGLQSDVDFVVVGRVDPDALHAAERRLNGLFPRFRDTLYAFAPGRPPRLRSASARDLRLGAARPLHVAGPIESPQSHPIGRGQALEILVYQLLAALAERTGPHGAAPAPAVAGGIWRAEPGYRLHKLATEALRVATRALGLGPDEALTFRAVHEHRGAPELRAVAPEPRIAELLRERERWAGRGSVTWSDELAQTVHRAIAVTLGRPGAGPTELLTDAAAETYDLDRPMHVFALAVLTAFHSAFPGLRDSGLDELEAALLARLVETWPGAGVPAARSLSDAVVTARWDYADRLMRLKDRGIPLWSKESADVG